METFYESNIYDKKKLVEHDHNKNNFNPYSMNGGSVVAIAGPNFSIIAADTRMSEGYIIHTRKCNKLYNISDKIVMGSCGFHGDVLTLFKTLTAKLTKYRLEYKKEISCKASVQMLSVNLYYRRFFPFYVYNIVAGLDEDGHGAVYSFDPVGSYERERYRACGSAASLLQPFLDNIKNHANKDQQDSELSIEEAIQIILNTFNAATERDIYTGDNLRISIITSDGVETRFSKLRHD